MATAIQWRRGTTSQHSSFTGLVGEITVDTDLNTVIVHDGSTAGGHRLAKASEINTQENIEDAVNTLLTGGTGITLTYDDSAGTLTIDGQTGDITGVTAGDGLSGGGTSGAVSLAVDLNELTAAAVDVAADSLALIDATDNSSKKETIADLATAMAGTGITATNGVFSATTGDITSVVAGASLSGGGTSGDVTLAFDGSAVAQHIIPSADITYDLGSSSKQWRDVYIGPGSLYVNGQKVIEDNSGTIQFSADANQNIGLITSGSGDVELNASGTGTINFQSGITVDSGQTLTGTGGLTMASNINLNSNSINNLPAPAQAADATNKTYVDGATYLTGGTGITNSSGTFAVDSTVVVTTGTQTIGGNKTFSNDIVVDGNFTVSGTTTTINTATLLLEDNIITLNAGTSGAPSENAGLTVDRGSSADVNFQFNESLDKWQFTNDGSTYVNIAVDTDTLTEGSTNLYFTNARADARADSRFATKLALADTGDLVEGSNLYYTNARADARIANALLDEDNMASDSATKVASQQSIKAYVASQIATTDNTDEMTEGSTNLYYTDARARASISVGGDLSYNSGTGVISFTNDAGDISSVVAGTGLSGGGTSGDVTLNVSGVTLSEIAAGSLLLSSESFADSDTQIMTAKAINDRIESFGYSTTTGDITTVTAGSGLSGGGSSGDVTINIGAGTGISVAADSIAVDMGDFSTSNLVEGSNEYHTSARVNTLIDSRVTNAFVDALNVDADTLDGISSASFLRSDANDSHSGTITPSSDNAVDLGSGSLRYNEVYAVTFQGTASAAQFADLAEKYESDAELEAGTVVMFGGDKEVTACDSENCHAVAGVISTDPAYMMNSDGEGQYVALTGRVPTKVTGPVAKGDLVVSAGNGRAMSNNNAQAGRIIGKAVGSSDGGEAVIEVLVNLM